ncbi:MAG: glycoside hydrolase family 27 protein [Oscillospiraceae bacterium]|nr:glycoside hydrolase family 27 protein [Oscillospiraceae bacterium]
MNKNDFARTPPMGWNSYDYYSTTVTEEQVKANAAVLAEKLKPFGWEYVVIDIQWYAHKAGSMRDTFQYIPFGGVEMDVFSRLLPDPERFPSSAGGKGFRPLADYIHGLGLKFGIHIMRGIPRAAAHRHGAILGTGVTADLAADPSSICRWNPDMYGLRDCQAGQAYYDSIIELYASWGVDFIKCDDICNTNNWNETGAGAYAGRHEIEMLARAIERQGRPIVLSLSPGPALIEQAWHYQTHANMWRITDDFWDEWRHLEAMFARCELWQDHVKAGCWPDCDMLPLGRLGGGFQGEWACRFTAEEQRTMMTLWCIFGSPLMLGAELTKLDEWTLSLLTNREVLALLDPERKRRQVCRDGEQAVWVSVDPADGSVCAAVFNLSGEEREVAVELEKLGVHAESGSARELWTGEEARWENGVLQVRTAPHGCKLLRIAG